MLMRNRWARFGRRTTGGGSPSQPAYDPTRDAASLLWWDPTTVGGAVASWVDRIASVAAAQATETKQPLASETVIGSTYPGVTGDGGDVLVASGAGAVLGGKSHLTLTAAMVDTETSVKIAIELTASTATTDGGFNIAPNDVAAGQLAAAARGTTGASERRCADAISTVRIVSVGYDFATAGADAVAFIRVNGVSKALTNVTLASAAGVAADAALYLFGRGTTPTLGWAGTFGDIVIRDAIAQDADLETLESWMGARVGLSL